MVANNAYSTYLHTHYEGMDPQQLILMLYEGALQRIQLAIDGINENDVRKRGENVSKVIAIVSELLSSLDPNIRDESTEFLRDLYTAILVELPKVSLTNDVKTLETTHGYISRLRDIWKRDVMGLADKKEVKVQKVPAKAAKEPAEKINPAPSSQPVPNVNRGNYNNTRNGYQQYAIQSRRGFSV